MHILLSIRKERILLKNNCSIHFSMDGWMNEATLTTFRIRLKCSIHFHSRQKKNNSTWSSKSAFNKLDISTISENSWPFIKRTRCSKQLLSTTKISGHESMKQIHSSGLWLTILIRTACQVCSLRISPSLKSDNLTIQSQSILPQTWTVSENY